MINSRNITYVSKSPGYTTPDQVVEWIREGGRNRIFMGDIPYTVAVTIDELLGDRRDVTVMSTTLTSPGFDNVFGVVQSDAQVSRYYESLNPTRVQVATDVADGVALGEALREVLGSRVSIIDYRLRMIPEPLRSDSLIIMLLSSGDWQPDIPPSATVYLDYRSRKIEHPDVRTVIPSPRDWNILPELTPDAIGTRLNHWDSSLNSDQIDQYREILQEPWMDMEMRRVAFMLVMRAQYPSIDERTIDAVWNYLTSDGPAVTSPIQASGSTVTLNHPDVRRELIVQLRKLRGSVETEFYDDPISVEMGDDIRRRDVTVGDVEYTMYEGLIPSLIEVCHRDGDVMRCRMVDQRSQSYYQGSRTSHLDHIHPHEFTQDGIRRVRYYPEAYIESTLIEDCYYHGEDLMCRMIPSIDLPIVEETVGGHRFVDTGSSIEVGDRTLPRSRPKEGLTPLRYTALQYVDLETRQRLIREWGLEGVELYLGYVTMEGLLFEDIEKFAGLIGGLNMNLSRDQLMGLWNQFIATSSHPKHFASRRYIDRTTGLPKYTTYDILGPDHLVTEDPEMYVDQNYGQIYGPHETLQRFSVTESGNFTRNLVLISDVDGGILRYDTSFSVIGNSPTRRLVSGYAAVDRGIDDPRS